MNTIRQLVAGLFVISLTACAATQSITEFDSGAPKNICVAKHDAVREGVLDALEEGFRRHGSNTKVVRGIYEQKHNMWNSNIYREEVQDCDAIAFYVANWAWDISMYMHFASIWITDTGMTRRMAQATYQTGGGPDKWIDAREKILELVDEMYVSADLVSVSSPDSPTETVPEVTQDIPAGVGEDVLQNDAALPPGSDEDIEALKKLKSMYEQGLITKKDYIAEKQEILDEM
jgi:hypothetical protein